MRMFPKTRRKIDASHLEKCEEEEPVCGLGKRGQENLYRRGCCSINYTFVVFADSRYTNRNGNVGYGLAVHLLSPLAAARRCSLT